MLCTLDTLFNDITESKVFHEALDKDMSEHDDSGFSLPSDWVSVRNDSEAIDWTLSSSYLQQSNMDIDLDSGTYGDHQNTVDAFIEGL